MIYSYGARLDNDSNAITVIDEENKTAVTTGYVNGEYVEFDGGGSSDFSTAIVTFVQTSTDPDGGGGWSSITTVLSDDSQLAWFNDFDMMYSLSPTQEVVLYKGHAMGIAEGMDMSVSGNATYDSENNKIDITGDCTISYVGASNA